jgi:hypothetical protein
MGRLVWFGAPACLAFIASSPLLTAGAVVTAAVAGGYYVGRKTKK